MQEERERQGTYCPQCRAIYQGALARCPNDGVELAPFFEDPMVGFQIADYVLEEYLGEGATGRVYRARHARLQRRKFAVKILLGDLAMDATMRTRFAHEADAASRLEHPNVVAVNDFGQSEEGLFYIAMEYVRGQTLAERIAECGHLSEIECVLVTRSLCSGLAHAHDKGLVHRDFKPENVVLKQQDGEMVPRILDFGLAIVKTPEESSARLTATGGIVGTPAYAAPEQVAASEVDARTDLFALGVSMYEMLGGLLPFDGNIMEILVANARQSPPSIEQRSGVRVSSELESIVMRLMEKRPDDRFQSAKELMAALDQLARARGWSLPSASRFPLATIAGAAKGKGAAKAGEASMAATLPATSERVPTPIPASAALGSALPASASGAPPSPASSAETVAREAAPEQRSGRGRWMVAVILAAGAAAAAAAVAVGLSGGDEAPPPAQVALAGDAAPALALARDAAAAAIDAGLPPADGAVAASVDAAEPAAPKAKPPEVEPRPELKPVKPARDKPVVSRPIVDAGVAPPVEPSPQVEPVEPPPKPVEPPPTVKPKPPVVSPAPKPALDATLELIELSSRGSLPVGQVRRGIAKVRPKLRSCYRDAARRAGRDQAMTVAISFEIAETRRARDVSVSGASLPGLRACLEQTLRGVRTRGAPDVGAQRVTFRVRFTPLAPK